MDGDYTPDITKGSCTFTSERETPWWAVDLASHVWVTKVAVANRADDYGEARMCVCVCVCEGERECVWCEREGVCVCVCKGVSANRTDDYGEACMCVCCVCEGERECVV